MIAEEYGGPPTMAASAFAGFAVGCLAGSLLAVLLVIGGRAGHPAVRRAVLGVLRLRRSAAA